MKTGKKKYGASVADEMNSDPFFILGRLKTVLNEPAIAGLSRSPAQRVAAARAILADYQAATDAKKKDGYIAYFGVMP